MTQSNIMSYWSVWMFLINWLWLIC